MLFWFVCVNTDRDDFLYKILPFCGAAVNVSEWLEVLIEYKKIAFWENEISKFVRGDGLPNLPS